MASVSHMLTHYTFEKKNIMKNFEFFWRKNLTIDCTLWRCMSTHTQKRALIYQISTSQKCTHIILMADQSIKIKWDTLQYSFKYPICLKWFWPQIVIINILYENIPTLYPLISSTFKTSRGCSLNLIRWGIFWSLW